MSKLKITFLLFVISIAGFSQHNLNIDSVAHFQYPSGISLNDIWGYVDTAGNEYALVGKRNGLSVVNVTDTNNLVEVFGEQAVYSVWRDIKTWGHYAYVTNESSGGLAIYDLSTLPDSVKSVSNYLGVNYPINSIHNIFIDENGVAYLFGSNHVNGSFGTVMLDVATNPGQPIELGYFDSLYLHDGYARKDTLYGSAVYAGELLVIDVSNKQNPIIVGSAVTPSSFTHNSWPSDNSKVIFTTDEVTNGFVASYDVSNVNNIVQLDRMKSRNTTGIIPHNTHVLNDFLITSYYTLGVSIVDANKPDNLVEIGYFDTSPNFNGGTFNGNWGAYPYLPSGLLLLSDMEEGLFVLRPKYKRASYLEGNVSDCNGTAISQAKVSILGQIQPDRTNLLGDFKMGSHLDGYQTITVEAAGFNTLVLDSVLLTRTQTLSLNIEMLQTNEGLRLHLQDPNGVAIDNYEVQFMNADTSLIENSNTNGNLIFRNIDFSAYEVYGGKWGVDNFCKIETFTCATKSDTIILGIDYEDNFNLDLGWNVSGNDVQGAWERAEPIGTIHLTNQSNPDLDFSNDCGGFAYVSGNGGTSAFSSDVDSTINLESPIFSLAGFANPYINFNSWFYNSPNGNDAMTISFLDNNNVEVLVKTINSSNHTNNWEQQSFKVSDFANPNNVVKIKLSATDSSPDHVLEVGIDNFSISDGVFVGVENNNSSASSFEVYPNPVNEELQLICKNENCNGNRVEVLDVNSRLVGTYVYNAVNMKINTSEYKSGIYFIKVLNENEVVSVQKFLKN